ESRSRAETPGPSAAAAKPARIATGGLRITSTPAGAQVLIDEKPRGVTPLSLADLTPGAHALELKSPDGTVRRSVTVVADKEDDVAESIFSGWVAVRAPFDLTVNEGGRAVRIDDRGQIMLPPGPHELRLVNRRLASDQVHRVEVKRGEIAALTIASPRSTVTITASEPAEVWIDGVRAGDTPLTDARVDVGTREIVVRRASGGAERKVTATVTTRPYTLNVDFAK